MKESTPLGKLQALIPRMYSVLQEARYMASRGVLRTIVSKDEASVIYATRIAKSTGGVMVMNPQNSFNGIAKVDYPNGFSINIKYEDGSRNPFTGEIASHLRLVSTDFYGKRVRLLQGDSEGTLEGPLEMVDFVAIPVGQFDKVIEQAQGVAKVPMGGISMS